MDTVLIYLYLITQAAVFALYIPHIRAVIKSDSADAISVPTQFAFFIAGAIAAIYMLVINNDRAAFLIICIHIILGNLTTAIVALRKQKKE